MRSSNHLIVDGITENGDKKSTASNIPDDRKKERDSISCVIGIRTLKQTAEQLQRTNNTMMEFAVAYGKSDHSNNGDSANSLLCRSNKPSWQTHHPAGDNSTP